MYETIENTLVGSSNKYFRNLKNKKVICVDFDNTICLDEWPNVGPIILNAIKVLKELAKMVISLSYIHNTQTIIQYAVNN